MSNAIAPRPNGTIEHADDEPSTTNANIEIASTRAAQEVQAAMTVAKRFPRDETKAFARIMTACQRYGLAEKAEYAYPRGRETVTGPSIRLAEVIAQHWGNLDYGVVEIEQRWNESVVMAYAWDLETNTRSTMVFTAKHERETKQGSYRVSGKRDIYEIVANDGARRLRACLLKVIPRDVVDEAREECHKTLAREGGGAPLIDRVRKWVAGFQRFGVTPEMIERHLRHKIETTSEAELANLRAMFNSLNDKAAGVEDFFERDGATTTAPAAESKTEGRRARVAAAAGKTDVREPGSDDDKA